MWVLFEKWFCVTSTLSRKYKEDGQGADLVQQVDKMIQYMMVSNRLPSWLHTQSCGILLLKSFQGYETPVGEKGTQLSGGKKCQT